MGFIFILTWLKSQWLFHRVGQKTKIQGNFFFPFNYHANGTKTAKNGAFCSNSHLVGYAWAYQIWRLHHLEITIWKLQWSQTCLLTAQKKMINLKKSCDYRLPFIAHKGDVWELNFQLQGRKTNQNNQQKIRIILSTGWPENLWGKIKIKLMA